MMGCSNSSLVKEKEENEKKTKPKKKHQTCQRFEGNKNDLKAKDCSIQLEKSFVGNEDTVDSVIHFQKFGKIVSLSNQSQVVRVFSDDDCSCDLVLSQHDFGNKKIFKLMKTNTKEDSFFGVGYNHLQMFSLSSLKDNKLVLYEPCSIRNWLKISNELLLLSISSNELIIFNSNQLRVEKRLNMKDFNIKLYQSSNFVTSTNYCNSFYVESSHERNYLSDDDFSGEEEGEDDVNLDKKEDGDEEEDEYRYIKLLNFVEEKCLREFRFSIEDENNIFSFYAFQNEKKQEILVCLCSDHIKLINTFSRVQETIQSTLRSPNQKGFVFRDSFLIFGSYADGVIQIIDLKDEEEKMHSVLESRDIHESPIMDIKLLEESNDERFVRIITCSTDKKICISVLKIE